MWSEIASAFELNNNYILVMLMINFFSLTIIFERFIVLKFIYHLNFYDFTKELKKMIFAEDLSRAINYCKSISQTSLPRIALKALEAAETDPTTVKGTLEEETILFLPQLETRIAILPSFATVILLIGILATIDGVWAAFHSLEVLDTAKKQASLSKGIADSLNPTAIGLMLSMLVLVGYQIINGIALRVIDDLHYGVTVLHNLLVPNENQTTYVPVVDPNAQSVPVDSVEEAPSEGESSENIDDLFEDDSIADFKDEEEII